MGQRISFQSIFMNLAISLSNRSTCSRLSVGAVVTTEDFSQVLGIGYNGNYAGGPNCCDSSIPGGCGCLHAEENSLLKVGVPSSVPKIMFVTHLPCKMCAKRIVNKGGFKKVYYKNHYRDDSCMLVFKMAGIQIEQFEE